MCKCFFRKAQYFHRFDKAGAGSGSAEASFQGEAPLDFCPKLRYNHGKQLESRWFHAAKTLRAGKRGRRHHPLSPGRGKFRPGKDRSQGSGDEIRSDGSGIPAPGAEGQLPEAGFLGEEGGASEDLSAREWVFIVDPIDGTTNFIQGYHNSCVSIGLARNGRIEYGVVFNPYDGELYAAQRGRGATLNGAPIRCQDHALDHSLLIFGSALYYRELVPLTLELFNAAFPLVQDIRRFGSAALDLCYLAAGKAGVFFEARLCPWDYAAGSLIAEEAGCAVTQLDGAPLDFSSKCSVLAGSPTAYRELLKRFRKLTEAK
ncbi:MAG: inositol monophosphatase [Oscillospiraceae bacterium]|nr:inositol monophosphatase [Oscillospiraceae bacterium]